MPKAPEQQPIIDIPGLDDASEVTIHSRGMGDKLKCRVFVQGKKVNLDTGTDWMDRSWFGLVVRELDRRQWRYTITAGRTTVWEWHK